MNVRYLFLTVMILSVTLALAGEAKLPEWFTNAENQTGDVYRATIASITNNPETTEQLEAFLNQETMDNSISRQARILLARSKCPVVFSDFDEELRKYRKMFPQYGRPLVLSGELMLFAKRGPEDRFVEEYDRDENGNIRVAQVPLANDNTNKLHAMQAARKEVEKYTDAEVQAGIARNAATRQAALEHFLKFLGEGSAYEQSEMVELIHRWWGRDRNTRTGDLALIDHVQDADDLIEAVYKDESRPLLARYTAAMSLPPDKQQGIQNLMLNIVTNANNTSEDLTGRALGNLESTGDASTLAILKSQTNGPAWKLQKIEKTSQVIDARLSKK